MLSRIADYITDVLVESTSITESDREIYQYGFEMGIAHVINVVSTLLIGLTFRMPLESIVFLLSFMTLRTYTGGYHAPSHLKCYLLSQLMIVLVLSIGHFIIATGWEYPSIALGVLGACLLVRLAPVEDSNKPLDEVEQVVFRKRAMRNLLIWSVITSALFFTSLRNISVILCLCLFMMGITAVYGHWKNRSRNKSSGEEQEMRMS